MITPIEWELIKILYTKPLTVADSMALYPGAKNILTRMLRKEYVRRRGAPYRYTLTPKGEAIWRLLK